MRNREKKNQNKTKDYRAKIDLTATEKHTEEVIA